MNARALLLALAACLGCDKGAPREAAAGKAPPEAAERAPAKRAPALACRVARLSGQATGLGAGQPVVSPVDWSLAAGAQAEVDLPRARLTLYGPAAGHYMELDGAHWVLARGSAHFQRAPGQGGRDRAWLATAGASVDLAAPAELYVRVRDDGAAYLAVLAGAVEVATGAADLGPDGAPRPVRRTLQAGSALRVSAAGALEPVPAAARRLTDAPAAAERALARLPSAPPVDPAGPLASALDAVTAERARGQGLHAAQRAAFASGDQVAAREAQRGLVQHAQRLARWRRVLRARLGRYLARVPPGAARAAHLVRARRALVE